MTWICLASVSRFCKMKIIKHTLLGGCKHWRELAKVHMPKVGIKQNSTDKSYINIRKNIYGCCGYAIKIGK